MWNGQTLPAEWTVMNCCQDVMDDPRLWQACLKDRIRDILTLLFCEASDRESVLQGMEDGAIHGLPNETMTELSG